MRAHGNLSDQQKEDLADNFPITTLDRLLSSREVRKRIGVDVKNRKLCSGLPAEELMKALRRIVLDLAEKNVNVSQLKNSAQQIAYIESLDSASKPDLSKAGAVRSVENIQSDEFKARPPRPSRRTARDPAERRTVIPRSYKLNVQDSKVAAIFKELKGLRVDEYPNAIAVLLRVFLELSVDHYMDSNSLPLKYKDTKNNKIVEKSLKKKIADVVEHLVAIKGHDRKDLAGVTRALSVEHSPLYIDLLHAYLHNRFVTPKTRDLIGTWDDASRFFERIWQ